MNKRYIDFVPVKPNKEPVKPTPIKPTPVKATVKATPKETPHFVVEKTEIEIIKARKIADHSLKTPAAPVKHPIASATQPATPQKSVSTVSLTSQSIEHEPFNIEPAKPAARATQPQFINTTAIKKRPLSKNVYKKPLAEPIKEEPAATITIIDKPKKESKVGLIITIILTIIFGAAVGTVAFLLLPK